MTDRYSLQETQTSVELVDTFSRWVKVDPARTEKVLEMSRVLLKELIPRCRMPSSKEVTTDNVSWQE